MEKKKYLSANFANLSFYEIIKGSWVNVVIRKNSRKGGRTVSLKSIYPVNIFEGR